MVNAHGQTAKFKLDGVVVFYPNGTIPTMSFDDNAYENKLLVIERGGRDYKRDNA